MTMVQYGPELTSFMLDSSKRGTVRYLRNAHSCEFCTKLLKYGWSRLTED